MSKVEGMWIYCSIEYLPPLDPFAELLAPLCVVLHLFIPLTVRRLAIRGHCYHVRRQEGVSARARAGDGDGRPKEHVRNGEGRARDGSPRKAATVECTSCASYGLVQISLT